MAQEAAKRRDDQLGAGTAEAPGLAHNELVRIANPEALERDLVRPEVLGEKRTDDGQVVRHRRRTDATLVNEEAFVRSFDPLDRSVAARTGNGGRDDTAAAQVAQQLPAGRCRAAPPAVQPASEESRDPLLVESLDAQLLALEPTAEVSDESELRRS